MKNGTGILLRRLLTHILRSPDTIITTALTPLALMLMFVYVFGGAIEESLPIINGQRINYVTFQLPGILLMTIASGIAYTAFRMFQDKQLGIFTRFKTMPIARSSALWAHVLTSLVSNAITVVIIFLVGLIMGFRSNANLQEWLAISGILLLFTLALTWLAVIPGLLAKSIEGASAFSYPLIFLPMLSSAFVPTETMPTVVRVFAENQPMTHIVDSIRNLLLNQPVGAEIWIALAWCIAITLVCWYLGIRIYKKTVA